MDEVNPATAMLSAKHLGQLLLMQSVLESLPDEQSIHSFVSRGLSEMPGVAEARIRGPSAEIQGRDALRFPLQVGEASKGELLVLCNDLSAFKPYEDYIRNFCFMVAVILEERHQRQIRESHRSELEQQVQERTRQLQSQVAERSRAEEQVRVLLAEAERARSALLDTLEDQKQAEETRTRLEAELRQSQKMEAVGQLAGGVAHDFNNLLTVIIGNATLLAGEPDLGTEMQELVRQITAAADRAANLTRQLLTFSRRQVMQVRSLNLNEVLSNISKMLHRLLGEHIALQCNYAPDLPHIEADAGMLEQIVVNLAVNARDAMPKGGRLVLSTQTEVLGPEEARRNPEARPGQFVLLTVADTGCGMDPTTLARIFEPFFTTKDVGKGTGLGLATVYGIAKQHNGWIEVASQLGRGTTFKLFLPAAARAGQRPTPASAQPAMRGGHETILVVEDEAAVRQIAAMCLRRLGYQVLEAGNGAEALRLWEGRQRRIDLVLTDMVMPEGLSGLDLVERLRLDQPELQVILCTGYSLELSLRGQPIQPDSVHLAKPFNTHQLAESVRRCLDGNATDGT